MVRVWGCGVKGCSVLYMREWLVQSNVLEANICRNPQCKRDYNSTPPPRYPPRVKEANKDKIGLNKA